MGDGTMSIDSAADAVVVSLTGRLADRGDEECRPDPRTRSHHDRLLRVEDDPDELVDLVELAVTWSELDWSESGVVPPEAWIDFAAGHRWRNSERVLRLFCLASDIALRGPQRPAADVPAPCTHAEGGFGLTDADLLAGEL